MLLSFHKTVWPNQQSDLIHQGFETLFLPTPRSSIPLTFVGDWIYAGLRHQIPAGLSHTW
jgi:hypothetical protein